MSDSGNSDWQSPGAAPDRPRYGEFAPPGQTPAPAAPSPYGQPAGENPYAQNPASQDPYAQMPGSASWAPPPKPGIVPLRPLSFGALLGAPFQMLRRSPGILGLSLLLQVLVLVVGGGIVAAVIFAGFARITDWNDPDQAPLIAGAIAGSILGGLGLFILNFVVSALLQGIVVGAAARSTLGERPTARSTWPTVKRRVWRLAGWTALLALAVLVIFVVLAGVVLLGVALGPVGIAVSIAVALLLGLGALVLWFWIYTKLSIVPSVLVLERTTIRAAITRSWSLTRGYFWRTLGAEFLVTAMIGVATYVITTPLSLVGSVGTLIDPNNTGTSIAVVVIVQILVAAVNLVGGAVSAFVTSAVVALIYIDLRMRKEGLDLVLQRHVEGGDPAADPFAPGPR